MVEEATHEKIAIQTIYRQFCDADEPNLLEEKGQFTDSWIQFTINFYFLSFILIVVLVCLLLYTCKFVHSPFNSDTSQVIDDVLGIEH